ncbi:hypothetical protein [Moraxella lacunata]|nr:hypothetical protein [Moraxella lacunata]
MKPTQPLKFLLGLMLICLFGIAQAKTIGPNNLINKSTLGCNFSSEQSVFLSDFYSTLLKDEIVSKNISSRPYTIKDSNYVLQGFYSIGHNFIHKDKMILEYTSLDLNFKKFNMNILRIAAFSENDDGDESFGYYFVIRGAPVFISKQLTSMGIEPQNLILEKTPAGNTRLKCILVG